MARLQQVYKEKVVPELLKEFAYKNVMQVPRVKKITLNMGVGEAVADKKQIENAVRDMTAIAGQKPVVTKARKSIAGFKIRDGWPIGCKVTLRGEHMWEFLDRLIAISIPRIRDFRGLNGKSFDGRGNYSMGVREQIMFPEIDYDKVDAIRGLDITITTSADTDEEGKALLKAFNFPFRNLLFDLLTRCATLCRHQNSLLTNRLTWALAGPRVCLSTLSTNWQTATMTNTTETTEIHQTLNIH